MPPLVVGSIVTRPVHQRVIEEKSKKRLTGKAVKPACQASFLPPTAAAEIRASSVGGADKGRGGGSDYLSGLIATSIMPLEHQKARLAQTLIGEPWLAGP